MGRYSAEPLTAKAGCGNSRGIQIAKNRPTVHFITWEPTNVSLSDRQQELKRRRHRKKKLKVFSRKLASATVSEKSVMAEKIRRMTPGCETVIENWELEKKR
jgi:hypothetical protein